MGNVNNIKTLENNNAFFDNFEIDLSKDLEEFYKFIGKEEMLDEHEKSVELSTLRNENHKRYYCIKIIEIEDLPESLNEYVYDIKKLYNTIESMHLLEENYEEAKNTKKLLDNIIIKKNQLDEIVLLESKRLTLENDNRQSKYNTDLIKHLTIDEKTKQKILEKYNDLVIFSSTIEINPYQILKTQIKRSNLIDDLEKLITKKEPENNLLIIDKLLFLNEQIDKEILYYKDKIIYLEDLIIENSKYKNEFENFKDYYNRLISYDDKDYYDTKRTYDILKDKVKFDMYINDFEDLFINERYSKIKEENFIYEKIGIENLKNSLDFISSNYIDKLNDSDKKKLNYIYDNLYTDKYNLKDIEIEIKDIVLNIWKTSITKVYNYNEKEDYMFLCSNNQFIDERYEAILITKKEIERVTDYSDYQIGFICEYNDNILYITENEDIMSVDYNDMSYLKTPIQIEQEFINFKVCNRIALNGYKTKITGVYFINDGTFGLYKKAQELADMYKLPLIELKKDKF